MSLPRLVLAASLIIPAPANAQRAWSISTTPSLEIPAITEAGEVNFGIVTSATRLPNGDIVVADGSAGALVRFSATGVLLSRAGRIGSGPGEFRSLRWMGQCGPDSLWTQDLNQPRLSLFTASGGFVRQVMPPHPATLVQCGATGRLILLTLGPPPAGGEATFRQIGDLFALTSANEFVQLRTGVPATEFALIGSMPVPDPLGRTTVLAVQGQEALLGTADSAVLERIGPDGQSLGYIRLPQRSRAPTAAEVARASAALLMNVPPMARAMYKPLIAQIPVPKALPPYFGLWTDPAGRLWVLRSPPGSPVQFTVVSNTGSILGEASSPIGFTPMEVLVDGILAVLEQSDGEIHLVILPFR